MKRGTRPDPPGRRLVFAAIAVAAVIVLGALVLWRRAPRNGDGVVAPSADYVGSAVCATCHAAESERWAGSHHQRAMLLPTEENVLADFQNTVFARRGVTTRFSRKGPLFMVATEGPDGKETEYAVKYVIGVDPVQQYIVEFPGWQAPVRHRRMGRPRPALVLPLPGSTDRPRRSASLDGALSELEPHVRRLPHHQIPEGIRSRRGQLPDHVVRVRRWMRGMPWPRRRPRGVG